VINHTTLSIEKLLAESTVRVFDLTPPCTPAQLSPITIFSNSDHIFFVTASGDTCSIITLVQRTVSIAAWTSQSHDLL
jgi:hypothetical protein